MSSWIDFCITFVNVIQISEITLKWNIRKFEKPRCPVIFVKSLILFSYHRKKIGSTGNIGYNCKHFRKSELYSRTTQDKSSVLLKRKSRFPLLCCKGQFCLEKSSFFTSCKKSCYKTWYLFGEQVCVVLNFLNLN